MKIEQALALAARGFRIFPLAPGSRKPIEGLAWKEEATTDPTRIRQWWVADPNRNIGVATGAGVLVIDADSKKGRPGLESLDLLDSIGLGNQSFRVRTPSGGMHVYLKTDHIHGQRVDTVDGFPGIDIRCDGGYVVGPGSTIGDASYEITSAAELVPAPWFDDILLKSAGSRSAKTESPLIDLDQPKNIDLARDYLTDRAPEAVEGAGGDDATYRVATRCRDYGLSEGVTLELMLEHWNETKASPPWMPDELAAKVANAYAYASGGWGAATAEAEFEVLDIDVGEGPSESRSADLGKSKKKILKILSYEDMVAMPEPEWLIEGVVPAGAAALLFGKSNAFKSFLAADMGLAVATGRDWHGLEVKKANVLFVATEGAVGFGRLRVPSWYNHYDIPERDRNNAWLFPQELSIDNKEWLDLLIATIQHKQIGLLTLDIFGGTMDGPETEDTTARAWVRGVQRIIRETGATVLSVAHTGWADETRARMHTHFWGSFDTRLKAVGDQNSLTTMLLIDRHKDADSTGQWGFRMEKTHGSLVPVLDSKAQNQDTWSPSLKLALRALESALNEAGDVIYEDGWPFCRVVKFDTWMDHCRKVGITSSNRADALRKAVYRARTQLEERDALAFRDGYVWNRKDEG